MKMGGRGPSTPTSGALTVGIPSNTPAGNYWFFACADDTNAVAEGDEANNCRAAARPLHVTP